MADRTPRQRALRRAYWAIAVAAFVIVLVAGLAYAFGRTQRERGDCDVDGGVLVRKTGGGNVCVVEVGR